jgi:hypothetical protein
VANSDPRPNSTNPRFDADYAAALAKFTSEEPPRPTALEIHPSPACQLRCPYCHSLSSGLSETVYSLGEQLLSLEEYATLFGEFAALGGTDLVVSGGGEPLLYPGYGKLVDLAFDQGLRIHVYTNGIASPRFSSSSLVQWLPRVTSLRFSLHQSVGTLLLPKVLANIVASLTARVKMGAGPRVHVGVLVDAFADAERQAILDAVVQADVDSVELRVVLPPSPQANQILSQSESLLRAGGLDDDRIHARIAPEADVLVPRQCLSLFRNVVVDPFGGFRLCCMRAHYPSSDHSFIGSTRDTSLRAALTSGIANMRRAGRGNCQTCSVRDSEFSERLLRDNMKCV